MKKVSGSINLQSLGVKVLTTRKTRAGGILFEVEGNEKAKLLAGKIWEVVGDAARVRLPEPRTPVLLLGVPEWADAENVAAGVTQAGARVCNAETCPKRGCTDLSLPTKIRFYNNYHNITYDEQSALLKSLMKISEVGRRRDGRNDATSRRTCTFKYTIDDLEVCRLTFIDTFQITKRRVETIQNKIKNNIGTPIDDRGKHRNRPHAIPNLVRQMIRQHIDSFPRQLSHYSRKNSEKEFLSSDLSLSKMYSLFIELNPDVKASKTLYEEVFTKEFNLRFGVPRSDTCKYCDMNYIKLISAKTEEERKNIEIQSNLHHSKADQAYKQLKQDADIARKNKNIIVLCVDLQQVLFCPNLTHSSIFFIKDS
ncbi:hypothetical protein QTP88_019542 [Uroleucon formosanum]